MPDKQTFFDFARYLNLEFALRVYFEQYGRLPADLRLTDRDIISIIPTLEHTGEFADQMIALIKQRGNYHNSDIPRLYTIARMRGIDELAEFYAHMMPSMDFDKLLQILQEMRESLPASDPLIIKLYKYAASQATGTTRKSQLFMAAKDDPALAEITSRIIKSAASDACLSEEPAWTKIGDLPDYGYFSRSWYDNLDQLENVYIKVKDADHPLGYQVFDLKYGSPMSDKHVAPDLLVIPISKPQTDLINIGIGRCFRISPKGPIYQKVANRGPAQDRFRLKGGRRTRALLLDSEHFVKIKVIPMLRDDDPPLAS
jgi:hypothetical protein